MCFDVDSSPPIASNPHVTVNSQRLTLAAADGNRFAAFLAAPERASGVGVVILPDVRGLHRFYTELGLRFAESGHTALVLDYYGRTAGAGERGDDFPYKEHMARLTPRGLWTDLTAAVSHLRAPEGGACQSLITVGFCLGGRVAILAAAQGYALAGVVGFYCWPAAGRDGAPGPTQRAADLAAPVLALMAGDDPGIPASDVAAFEAALRQAGVDHEVVTYAGAPHSFFDVKQRDFTDASTDAWRRVLAFVQRVSAPPALRGQVA
ncbi:dienelactone hydrolase family protein [Pyxidicoccus sp. MSG2]|uniref:dienelactone hydrolase family protein n=1 Tax=Pyxidicoccus sp. MSG2 TaxID=2996790 RepID=UPI00226E09AE|nr:dienelactone hydrolase family protein [Pyxidicoccus sp. MSG2]MCY1017448.1 dienelactone hydrolase family protein [Pyxidicoccus sp. MSG2]